MFDILAWIGGFLLGQWVRRRWLPPLAAPSFGRHPLYFVCAIAGAAAGAFGLGTLNMALSGMPGGGRSILGGLFGAIVAVEAYKGARGVGGSTGIAFVPSLCFGIAVGRVGCFLSGLDDFTYGIPTALPWGWDFGDGIARHPVQLYEAAAMLAFLSWFLIALARRRPLVLRHGFALFAGVYGLQRFAWEFLKPYAAVAGPFNVFHLVCLLLGIYSCVMILRRENMFAR